MKKKLYSNGEQQGKNVHCEACIFDLRENINRLSLRDNISY